MAIQMNARASTYRKNLSPIPSIPLAGHQILRICRTRLRRMRIHLIGRTPMRLCPRAHTSRPRTLANHRIRFCRNARTSRAHRLPLMFRRLSRSTQFLPARTLCFGFGPRFGRFGAPVREAGFVFVFPRVGEWVRGRRGARFAC